MPRPPRAGRTSSFDFLSDDTQVVWADILARMGETYEYTTVNSFTGQVSTGCGTATSAVGPFYCPADRQVYLDLEFFDELRSRFGAPGDFAQAYVVAHEVGHHVQNLLGTSAEVRRREQAASSQEEANQWSVRLELQADCYAGIWAHSVDVRGREEGSDVALEPGDIEEGLAAAEAVGDDRIQSQAGADVQPGDLDPRLVGTTPRVVHPGLRVGQPGAVRHLRSVTLSARWVSRLGARG